MAETMYAAPGIGLAATQVNVAKRIVVIDTSERQERLQVFINPVATGIGELIETEEGCLSVRRGRACQTTLRCTFPHGAKTANPLNCMHQIFLQSVFSTKLIIWTERSSSIISPNLNATVSENSYCARGAVQANLSINVKNLSLQVR